MKIKKRTEFSLGEKYYFLCKSDNCCARCGRFLYVDKMTVEHVIPLSKGGTNSKNNLVALCWRCNTYKSNKLMLPSRYYKHLNPTEAMYLDGDYRRFIVQKLGKEGKLKENPTIIRYSEKHKDFTQNMLKYFSYEHNLKDKASDECVGNILKEKNVFGIYVGTIICGLIIKKKTGDGVEPVYIVPIHGSATSLMLKCLRYILINCVNPALEVKIYCLGRSFTYTLLSGCSEKCRTAWWGSKRKSIPEVLELVGSDIEGILYKDLNTYNEELVQ